MLRHTFATHLAQKGMPPKTVFSNILVYSSTVPSFQCPQNI
ncbi:hypothetical protein [Jeotgalibacillus sp. ET6]